MTALALTPVTASPQVGFTNLLRAELRKLFDSRGGKIALAVIMLLAVAPAILVPLVPSSQMPNDSWQQYAEIAAGASPFVVQIIAVILFTAEWGQRSIYSTFITEPRRNRVLWAKLTTTVALAVGTWVFVHVVGAMAAGILDVTTSLDVTWGFEWRRSVGMLALMVLLCLEAAAMGLLLMNTPFALVVVLVAPTLFGILESALPAWQTAWQWVSPLAPAQYLNSLDFSGNHLWQLLSLVGIWVVVPCALGWLRQTRTEVS